MHYFLFEKMAKTGVQTRSRSMKNRRVHGCSCSRLKIDNVLRMQCVGPQLLHRRDVRVDPQSDPTRCHTMHTQRPSWRPVSGTANFSSSKNAFVCVISTKKQTNKQTNRLSRNAIANCQKYHCGIIIGAVSESDRSRIMTLQAESCEYCKFTELT